MMEFSVEMPDDVLSTFRRHKPDCSPLVASCQSSDENDIIETSKLSFSDDEFWLRMCPRRSDTDLQEWVYFSISEDSPASAPKLTPKNIDTRTFTRPKKRFTRPSIEKYNEQLYGSDLKELTDSGIQINGCSQDDSPIKPLHFDLGQSITSGYFETILCDAPLVDSFQNMSPPSLVNSMCSSTFANLMESSFIKNDPVLREIRDTDYTGSILQQESEPMFQSITESYSSLNSDVPENFLKKVSWTEKGNAADITIVNDATFMNNATFEKEAPPCDQTVILNDRNEDFHDAKATIQQDLNSTYQRKPSTINNTTSTIKPEAPLNTAFQRRKNSRYATKTITSQDLGLDPNATITIEPEKPLENVKRLLDRRPSPSLDLNRLSYLVDKNEQQHVKESPKRNSFGSTDSGENLDYMSLSSGSSKSSKPQSTDGINMIVDMPETKISMGTFRKSPHFQQIMSTPKPALRSSNLWLNHEISPIRDRNSDPEMSSNEHMSTPANAIKKQKSVSNIHQRATPPRGGETKVVIRSSHPNLRMVEPRTYGLQRPSNLNSMGHTLKGSYTSLRPTNANLPVAPPPLDATVVRAPPPAAQVPPVPREASRSQLVTPRPVKSGLPRPVSRIPGPRSIRPVSKSAGYQGRY